MITGFLKLVLPFGIFIMLQQISFKEKQRQFARVNDAYTEKEDVVKNYFQQAGIPYLNFQVFIRAFKSEQQLEVWVKPQSQSMFQLLKTYPVCTTSGTLGPKRKEGDLQIPEGLYHINHFNPQSNFHLSLGVSYPNASDKILSDPKRPGGAIYVHGNCVTIGCLPITDDLIKELYIICVEARNYGQEKIPIHIFPSRLDTVAMTRLRSHYAASPKLISFWENLQPMFEHFEKTKTLRPHTVDKQGNYKWK